MNLKEIMQKYKCDKVKHLYYREYEKEFETRRYEHINILEVGIWKGTSHSAWIDYFPNGQVYGIDIFTRITPEEVSILQHPRMHYIIGDSRNTSIVAEINKKWPNVKFDYIIDDGLHTPNANALTFNNLQQFLKSDGCYYVEDVWPLDILTPADWNHSWLKKKPQEYNIDQWNIFKSRISDFDVTNVDLRHESKMPDSYMVKIQ